MKITTTVTYDEADENGASIEARGLLEATWPIYYYGIACNNSGIANAGRPIYDNAQALLKALIHKAYPMIPAAFVYESFIECGELLSSERITELWLEHLDYNL